MQKINKGVTKGGFSITVAVLIALRIMHGLAKKLLEQEKVSVE